LRSCRAIKASGFTLIELVVVVLVIGVLAAISLPKFSNLTFETHLARANTMAAAITTATSNNFLARKAGSANSVALNQTDVCSSAVLGPLVAGGIPANYNFLGPNSCAGYEGGTVNCTFLDTEKPDFSVFAVVTCAN
jgi:prepilin-type N-terminal cleavage/methylation domain-containing protein